MNDLGLVKQACCITKGMLINSENSLNKMLHKGKDTL